MFDLLNTRRPADGFWLKSKRDKLTVRCIIFPCQYWLLLLDFMMFETKQWQATIIMFIIIISIIKRPEKNWMDGRMDDQPQVGDGPYIGRRGNLLYQCRLRLVTPPQLLLFVSGTGRSGQVVRWMGIAHPNITGTSSEALSQSPDMSGSACDLEKHIWLDNIAFVTRLLVRFDWEVLSRSPGGTSSVAFFSIQSSWFRFIMSTYIVNGYDVCIAVCSLLCISGKCLPLCMATVLGVPWCYLL